MIVAHPAAHPQAVVREGDELGLQYYTVWYDQSLILRPIYGRPLIR